MFGFKVVQVKEQSMEPTIKNNDVLLIKTHFKLSSLKQNDVVIVNSPVEKNLRLIKRIVGIPGDIVQIYSNNEIVVKNKDTSVDNDQINDDWIEYEWSLDSSDFVVLSDNKQIKTHDSRLFGPITFEDVVGKVVLKIKPFSRIK